MKYPSVSALTSIFLIVFWCSSAASADNHDDFLECLAGKFNNNSLISNILYTPSHSSYSEVLQFSIWNLRFNAKSTRKPQVIITPEHESQIPPIVYCARESDVAIRIRSGGHDLEGLSYVAKVPFVIIDLIKMSGVTVDVEEKTAWVEAGASLGNLYYSIAEKSPVLGFPAGSGPTVGVGGHISGGGYGTMFRKYGLAADNVIDARMVDVNGRILDRKSMGEDLFWAIRGGGGASFGVIVAWKLQLVDVPEIVTVFRIQRSSEQNVTDLIHRWQYVAPKIDNDLFITLLAGRVGSGQDVTIGATFFSLFLGGIDRLLHIMQESFPELGLVREDCTEMSWIDSTLYIAGLPTESREILLNRNQVGAVNIKVKTDYIQTPIPKDAFEGLWRHFYEPEGQGGQLLFVPFGGRVDEYSESAVPFPHRAGNLYELGEVVFWMEDKAHDSEKFINWVRGVYNYMTPYASKSPRLAYYNYRDLDIGVNNDIGETSYEQASIWGKKYFNNNFDRLVQVKTMVDPENFFKNEQSIPPLPSMCPQTI